MRIIEASEVLSPICKRCGHKFTEAVRVESCNYLCINCVRDALAALPFNNPKGGNMGLQDGPVTFNDSITGVRISRISNGFLLSISYKSPDGKRWTSKETYFPTLSGALAELKGKDDEFIQQGGSY